MLTSTVGAGRQPQEGDGGGDRGRRGGEGGTGRPRRRASQRTDNTVKYQRSANKRGGWEEEERGLR